jgi:hypothetical protein
MLVLDRMPMPPAAPFRGSIFREGERALPKLRCPHISQCNLQTLFQCQAGGHLHFHGIAQLLNPHKIAGFSKVAQKSVAERIFKAISAVLKKTVWLRR